MAEKAGVAESTARRHMNDLWQEGHVSKVRGFKRVYRQSRTGKDLGSHQITEYRYYWGEHSHGMRPNPRKRKARPAPPTASELVIQHLELVEAYLEQLARYWRKKRKPVVGPEPSRSGRLVYLTRDNWKTTERKPNVYELVISWSEAEPGMVRVGLDTVRADGSKGRWFDVGTPSAKLYEFARDPGVGTLGRLAAPNPAGEEQYEEQYRIIQHEEQEFAVGEFYRSTAESPSGYDFEWVGGELLAFERKLSMLPKAMVRFCLCRHRPQIT